MNSMMNTSLPRWCAVRVAAASAAMLMVGACDSAGEPSDAGFSVVIDGVSETFDEVRVSAVDAGSDVVQLHIAGVVMDPPGAADAGKTMTLVLEVDTTALGDDLGVPIAFAGDATFGANANANDFDSLADDQISWTADTGSSPVVVRAWFRNSCFCSRYGEQVQSLSGELTVDSFDGTSLSVSVALDLEGTIPFHGSGFGGEVSGVLSADVEALVE